MSYQRHKTLGREIVPLNYQLKITPNLNTFKFLGNEVITLDVNKRTKRVMLNASHMKILDAWIAVKGKTIKLSSKKLNQEKEELGLEFEESFSGNVKLFIDFEGDNNDKMYGFYRSKYTSAGKEHYMLTSQFEAADARSAFPCFDEPEFKATFDVSFVIPKDLDSISNTEIKYVKNISNSLKEVSFHTTPRMSTYLLYLGIGKFDYLEGRLGSLKIRVVTVPGKKNQSKIALDYARKFIDFYQKYFRIKYPLSKIDLIAVPDFAAGAMENWGAITFREVALLATEKGTPVSIKQQIAETIAHELAHQWFGDLVTMNWWDDLWLNESFATFMSYKAMDAVFPKWDMMKQYLDDTISTALAADQYKSTHPISVKVNTPAEVDQIFDEISYEKGGSVLYMIENYVGKDVFRDGLTTYLKEHSYSNATKYDLWNAIDGAAGKSGKKLSTVLVATAWINKSGYPIVNVSKNGEDAILKQERFLVLGHEKKSRTWPIPIHYMLSSNKQGSALFDKKSIKIKIGGAKWIKVNYTQSGLYRVVYDRFLLKNISTAISNKSLSGADAWGIENDLFAYARSGRISIKEYLEFVKDCCYDSDYPLNFGVSGHLSWLRIMSRDEKWLNDISEVDFEFHRRVLANIGWTRKNNETNITTMLRGIAISRLGIYGDKDTVSRLLLMFNQIYSGKGDLIDPNLKSCIYSVSAWHGDARTYSMIVDMYKKATMPDEKRRLLGALANFRSKDLINKALEFSISKDVRLQDTFAISAIASSNPKATDTVWIWTRKNWKLLKSRFDRGTHMLSRFVENESVMKSENSRIEVRKFFERKENMREDIKKSLAQTLERIEANVKFVEKNR